MKTKTMNQSNYKYAALVNNCHPCKPQHPRFAPMPIISPIIYKNKTYGHYAEKIINKLTQKILSGSNNLERHETANYNNGMSIRLPYGHQNIHNQ